MHNNSNILSFGSRVVGQELAQMIVKNWLEARYIGGRHERRVEEIAAIENGDENNFIKLIKSKNFDGKEKYEDQPL